MKLTVLKVEAGTGLGGPGLEPVGAGEQTGVAACSGQLGRGRPEGNGAVERTVGGVRIE